MHFFNSCQAIVARLLLVLLFLVPTFFHRDSQSALATADDPTPIPYPFVPDGQESPRPPAPQPTKAAEVALSGWFTIIWGDGEPGSDTAVSKYLLIDDNGRATQMVLDEALVQSIGGVLALNRQRVEIEGVWAMPPTAVAGIPQLQVQSIRPAALRNTPATAGSAVAVTGSQPWVSLLCKFADVGNEPNPLSYFQAMYGAAYPGLDHYWREQSDGVIDVGGSSAFGWYTLPQPQSYYVYDQDGEGGVDVDFGRAAHDCTAVADADVYFPDYVGINLMFNASLGCCAWGGGWHLNRDGVSQYWHTTWEPPWGYQNLSIMGHEMGHGFGLPHSSGPYGETYDNEWDVMSGAWANCFLATDPVYGCLGQHTISYHKDRLAWIPAGQKYTALPESSATITLERLALPQSDNYLMAQIPIGGSDTRFYTVEVRQTVGYDVRLPGQGVIIHEVDTTRAEPAHVVDVDGNGDTGDEGAIWRVGESFVDAANGITVSIDEATATGFVVTIDLATDPQVVVSGVWTADGDWNARTHFDLGDPIQWVVNVSNSTGAAANVELTYDVRGPNGEEVTSWSGIVTTEPGTWSWGLPGTLPAAIDGRHTFVGSVRYQGDTSLAETTYLVAPANDDFEQAIAITATPYVNAQNTVGATTAGDDPLFACGSGDRGSASVWYHFTPASSGILSVHTEDSDYDTMLALWQGDRGDLTSVACDDDGGAGFTSSLTAELEAATTYYLEIARYGTGGEQPGGHLALTVNFTSGAGPTLHIPERVPAYAGQVVSVPVNFTGNGANIASTTFSLDFDEACLDFDGTDADQDGIPDSLNFHTPNTFGAAATFDPGDSDGELDILIADTAPPLSALADNALLTVTFTATCQPGAMASIGFSPEPAASFGNTNGQGVPGQALAGSVEILSGRSGDCNGDGAVDAGDISAAVLEIFDGDGSDPASTAGGTFAGHAECDANVDVNVDAGDISCVVLIIFEGHGACAGGNALGLPGRPVTNGNPRHGTTQPVIGLPEQVPAEPGATVTLPITFSAADYPISSLVFSLDYDESWLAFDPTDSDADGVPDAITLNLPATFSGSVTFNGDDPDGELDFMVADLFPPLSPLADGELGTITFNVGHPTSVVEAAVRFSQQPPASFGSTSGQSVPGSARDGSVMIGTQPFQVYLPLITRNQP